jgi:nitric oxide reductase activation protein
MRPGKEDASASLLILLDLSASTNDPVREGGESMLDLEKQAALVLADAVSGSATRLAIHGFSSNTRHEINYYRLLDFSDRLDERRKAVIGSVRADYSTRMGGAIRHAAACLGGETTAQRFIVVMTDGAPSDIDVYEPGYLIQDARVAVQDARKQGVRAFCLTTDPQATKYVRTIFGAGNYQILDNPHQLCARLSRVFARLAAS